MDFSYLITAAGKYTMFLVVLYMDLSSQIIVKICRPHTMYMMKLYYFVGAAVSSNSRCFLIWATKIEQ